jgi:hypothetical protein
VRIGERRHGLLERDPVLRRFAAAFLGSHSNSMSISKGTLGHTAPTRVT